VRRMIVLCVIVSVALIAGSCKKKQDIEADKAAIRELVREDTVHFATSTQHDSTTGGYFADGDTGVFWWRGTQTHDSAPGINVEVVGDSAWVEWSQHNYGYFHVLMLPPGETLQLYNKRLSESVRLQAIFTREGRESDDDRGWRFRRISLATGTSDTVNTVRIDSLRIQSSLQNIVIRDPLHTYYRLDSLVAFTPGEQVTVTLYTNATEGIAFLHTFVLVWPFYIRLKFDYQGQGVFSGTWHAQGFPSFRFAIFDLMLRGTIYNPATPYDFNGWLFPYRIKTAE